MTLVVADGLGAERNGDVAIVDAGSARGRASRMLRATGRVLEQALRLDADIYHLHDPELIPAGLRLKRLGKTVIFDAHEDVPLQLLSKPYLRPATRRALAAAYGALERYACRRFDGIVAATPSIRDKFLQINNTTIDVSNYPLLCEFGVPADWQRKLPQACYVGSIAAVRGIGELVAACATLRSGARVSLAGRFDDAALQRRLMAQPGWERIDMLGHLDRTGVAVTMARSMAGLVTLHAAPNYLDALPVKMFEYMAAGIPVIASGIPLWRSIVETSNCGVCVDPADPRAIAAAIDYLVTHPEQARRMGLNGRRAVVERYHWAPQGKKLVAFYEQLQERTAHALIRDRGQALQRCRQRLKQLQTPVR